MCIFNSSSVTHSNDEKALAVRKRDNDRISLGDELLRRSVGIQTVRSGGFPCKHDRRKFRRRVLASSPSSTYLASNRKALGRARIAGSISVYGDVKRNRVFAPALSRTRTHNPPTGEPSQHLETKTACLPVTIHTEINRERSQPETPPEPPRLRRKRRPLTLEDFPDITKLVDYWNGEYLPR